MARDDTIKAKASRTGTDPAARPDGDGHRNQQRPARTEGFPLLTDAVSQASTPLFIENLRRGAKPAAEWMCGVEFELFGYDNTRRDLLARIDATQVQRVLAGFAPSSNDLVYENGVLIEVNAGKMNRLTVEPGGQ